MSGMDNGADVRIDFTGAAPTAGSLDVVWNHGVRGRNRSKQPPIQIHRYEEHTVIMRQSKIVHDEAPFIFLLFGNDRVMLLDTGATEDPTAFPLRATVDRLVAEWLKHHPRDDYHLVVAHTHAHGDHVAGDVQFEDRPNTAIVGTDLESVQAFFGFDAATWPTAQTTFDLGGRVIDVLPSPGHHVTAVTLYDRWTGIMFTGDTVLPGRIYAFDYPTLCESLDRMVAFADEHPVHHVFGCHVEMSVRPGHDFPIFAQYQPRERAPQMTPAQLTALRDAARAVAEQKGVHRFDDFIIYNEPGEDDKRKLIRRGTRAKRVAKARARLGF